MRTPSVRKKARMVTIIGNRTSRARAARRLDSAS
jgi:hypothetical protein